MVEPLLELLHEVARSPWLYALVFVAVAVDAFLPLVPSETVVITSGVFAATGQPDVLLLMAVAAVGAFVGDHVGYRIGAQASRLTHRLGEGHWGRPSLAWAERQLQSRGAALLVGSRFVPGGRTVSTLAAGLLRYPRRRFLVAVAVASAGWAAYATSLGLLGGAVMGDRPGPAILCGLGVAAVLGVAGEVVRRLGVRRRVRRQGADPAPDGVSRSSA